MFPCNEGWGHCGDNISSFARTLGRRRLQTVEALGLSDLSRVGIPRSLPSKGLIGAAAQPHNQPVMGKETTRVVK
jgi:hypothetical protein